MNGKLLIIGAGGHGRVVADTALKTNKWSLVSFIDRKYPNLEKIGKWNVIGVDDSLIHLKSEYDAVAVAVGDNKTRLNLLSTVEKMGLNIATIIHPSAQIGDQVTIGRGCVIFSNVVINYGATIGDACIINTAAIVEHDCKIGDGVHLSPGVNLGGGVSIGTRSWVGIGASVINNRSIGSKVIIGAGSTVINNVPDGLTVVGSPARSV